MSEVANERQNVTDNKDKEEFKITIDEHMEFEPICDSKFITSTDLCTLFSQLFSQCFADYEGCSFETPGGVPSITLYFNHKENLDPTKPLACSKDAPEDKIQNSTLRRTRLLQDRMVNGDRFRLTEVGKSGLKDLIVDDRRLLNQNNDIQWNKIVSDVVDPASGFMVGQQYTQVTNLDPAKILGVLYGSGNNDENWAYAVQIIKSMPVVSMGQVANKNFMLNVLRVSDKNITEFTKKIGLTVSSGLNIIR